MIGIVLASSFRPDSIPVIIANWPAVLLVVAGTLTLSWTGGFVLSRVTAIERKTTIVGSLPGAAAGMIAVSESLGSDTRLVALIQYIRVVLVVLSATLISRFLGSQGTQALSSDSPVIPSVSSSQEALLIYGASALVALSGAWGGLRLKVPAGALLGPLVIGVVLKEIGLLSVGLPDGVSQVAYAVIGVQVGLLFDSSSLRRAGRVLPAVLVSTILLMIGCAGLGLILSAVTDTNLLTGYLSTTPGGLSSVSIIAVESEADPSLAITVQMLRVFAVISVAPLLTRRWRSGQE
jgi:membrane AbrB-like protein